MTTALKPTDEQIEIIDAFKAEYDIIIEAGAGTGKSSTLKMLGEAKREQPGIYIAFNKAVADEAREKFSPNVNCGTAHSFAFKAIGHKYAGRLNGPRVQAKDLAEWLGLKDWIKTPAGRKDISSWRVASLATQTVRRFCHSSDLEITAKHVPFVVGVGDKAMAELRQILPPLARKIWEDIQQLDGFAKFEHDHYLKIWSLSNPKLYCDYVFLDEAQDTNPVLASIIDAQEGNVQRVAVGDAAQQLFAWRGAEDFMKSFDADERLQLTQSFRFGDAIAEEANRWLSYLNSDLRLRGLPSINSRLIPLDDPDAILCRTNADVISQAMQAQEDGKEVGVVGGVTEIMDFAKAAVQLKETGKTSHQDLAVFKTWKDVQTYVTEEQPDGSFGTFVRLLDRFGPEKVMKVATNCVSERKSDVVVATVHKVKGLEWNSVAVDAGVVPDDSGDDGAPDGEMMVAYVAVTRAKTALDATAVEPFHQMREKISVGGGREALLARDQKDPSNGC